MGGRYFVSNLCKNVEQVIKKIKNYDLKIGAQSIIFLMIKKIINFFFFFNELELAGVSTFSTFSHGDENVLEYE